MAWTRALGAAGALGVLVGGVPLALWALAGTPFPEQLPSGADLARALTRGVVSEDTLVKALALVCWLVWAQLVAAITVELAAVARRRPSGRAPALAPLHALAAALVAAAFPLTSGLDNARGSDQAPTLPDALARVQAPLPASSPPPSASDADESETTEVAPMDSTPTTNLPSHVVTRRETLWSIAETRLGAGARWREVFALNRGRRQADGGALVRPEDPVRPGWELALPTDAKPQAALERPTPASPSLERSSSAPDAGALVRAAEEAERLAHLAEVERLDAVQSLPPSREDLPEPSAPGPSATDAPVVIDVSGAADLAAVDDLPVRSGSLLERLTGAGLMVGGVLWTLEQVRRVTERRRLPHATAGLPPPAAVVSELSLRAAADPDLVAMTDLALKTWARRLREEGRPPPPVVGVNLAEDLSLLFAAPDDVPVDGFACEDGGYSWVTSLRHDLDRFEAGIGEAAPLPALFTIGHTDRSQVLFNAEAVDVLSVTGADDEVGETLLSAGLELVTGPWARGVRVVSIGSEELARVPGVKAAATLHDVAVELYAAVEATAVAGREHGVRNGLEARILGLPPNDWTPTVVIAQNLDGAELERLAELAASAPAGGLTAVVGGHVADAEWRLDVAGDHVTLHPVGVTLQRHRVGPETCAALGALLEDAARPAPRFVAVTDQGNGHGGVTTPSVEVRILGPVDVSGAAGPFERRKALELVAFLALHRRGVDGDALAEALWPDRLASPRTLHAVASLARRALGPADDGRPLLAHAGADSHYLLDPRVALDVERFSGLVGRADAAEPEEAAEHLRAALELVRGRPFTVSGCEYLWAHAEALVSAITAEVANAAHRLACLYLEARDPRGTWWATQRGLLASPGNEQLHRDRMLAADLAGNPAGVEEVVEELCRAVEIDRSEMRDVLHPMTIDLYERLARRSALRTMLSGA